LKIHDPVINEHFSKKEQEVFKKLLQGGNYQLVGSMQKQVAENMQNLLDGSD